MSVRLPSFTAALILCLAGATDGQTIELDRGTSVAAVSNRTSTTSAATDQPVADQLIHQVIAALEKHGSVNAKFRQLVNVFDQRLAGKGLYLQGPPGSSQMRFELSLPIADRMSSQVEVCNGHYLWTHRQEVSGLALTRLDVQKVFAKQREAAGNPANFAPRLAMAGLRRLLDSLAASVIFTSADSDNLGELRVWRAEGGWSPSRLSVLLPDQQAAIESGGPVDLTQLKEHVPDRIVVFVGTDDLFPYRIEYRRSDRTLVMMEFFDVKFDAHIDARQFRYQTPDQEVTDITESFLQAHGLSR